VERVGFGESYDILLPEEGEIDEESENESEEEKDFENDVANFLEQIISVHVRNPLMKEGGNGAPSSFLKCNCLRSDCRISQYLGKNVMSNTIKGGKLTTPSSKTLYSSRNLPSEYSTSSSSSNILSDNHSSNSEQTGASSTMLNIVLQHKNNLNLPSSEKHDKPDAHDYTKLKTQHHTTYNQNYDEKSSQVITKCQEQYHNHNTSTRNKREQHKYVSCYSMPDLPNVCSIELRKAHGDILQRAGGTKRVNKLYDELAFLSHCLGGWRILLENSPKDGNTLLMWLCCQPHKQQQTAGRKIRGVT
jgi:hypothetical protein